MTIIDAGPLVALIDPADIDHQRCINAAAQLLEPKMVTTWPCLTEAMYLVGRRKGYLLQDAVWRMYRDGVLDIHLTSPDDIDRIQTLMSTFRDTPMDLADASIVAACEALPDPIVFTIDSHFYAYRTIGGQPINLVPIP